MRKIKVDEAAQMLGVSPQYVRLGLQRNVFDFGVAFKVKKGNVKYNYVIYPEKLMNYVGEERFNEVINKKS